MTELEQITKKICVIGEAAVGKTSLIRRFVIDEFDDKYIATIGSKISKKTLHIKGDDSDANLKLMIQDITGRSSFAKIQKIAFEGAHGAFLVLDLTRRETLYSFDIWLYSLYEVTGEIPVVVLANKCDLEPEFGPDRIEELVKEYGFPYYLTSAKTGENVNGAFNVLGEMMIKPWEGLKIKPKLEISKVLERRVEKEPGGKLTPLGVEDRIMARYCELLEDTDLAMTIWREQIKRAGVDFGNPTAEGLSKVADYLIKAAAGRIEAKRLEKERKTYTDLIRRIGEDVV